MTTALDQTMVIEDQPAPAPLFEPEEPRGNVRLILVIVACVVAFVVLVVAVAEWIARSEAERRIAESVAAASAFPPTQRVDVDIAGAVLPQLLLGRFGEVIVSADNLYIEPASSNVSMTITDLPVYDDVALPTRVSGEAWMNGAQASGMFPGAGTAGFGISFSGSDLVMSADLRVDGQAMPLSIAKTPEFADGRLSARLGAISLGDTPVSAETVVERLGSRFGAVLQGEPVCVAEMLPRGVTVRDVAVRGQEFVVSFDIDPRMFRDTSLEQPGSCA